MHVAVTGASGFVGSKLAGALQRLEGTSVTLLTRPSFDLRRPETLDIIPRHIDVLVHAAGVVGAIQDSLETWMSNLIATRALADHLAGLPSPPYLLFLSTGAVNGPSMMPAGSVASPRGWDTYALTKYLAEEVIRHTYPGRWGIARLYFPFGPGQRSERLIPRLVAKIVARQAVNVGRGGGPALSPIFIDDLARVLVSLIEARHVGTVSVAGPEVWTVEALARELAAGLGQPVSIEKSDIERGDIVAPALDGFKYTSISDALSETVRSLRV